jgi:ABC-type dipeptide/oligopeptide/nickel transport system permease component
MFLVTLILFFLMLKLPPEQRVLVYLPSMKPGMTPEEIDEVLQRNIERYGLNEPFPVQYTTWLGNILSGDWGYSPAWRQPVLEGLLQRTPASIELALAAMIPGVVLALFLGAQAARRYQGPVDHVIRTATFLGWAFPSFILALILINVLYAWLKWFPPERLSMWAVHLVESENYQVYTGLLTIDSLLNRNFELFIDAVRHLVLPAFTLAIAQWALLARIMRSSLLEVLGEDYITTARSKGLSEHRVINRHARRNAILPVISTGTVVVSFLISGVIVVEAIFNFEGVGYAAVQAILAADVPAVIGFTLFSCIVTVIASLVADLLYGFIDPRTRTIQGSAQT